MKLLLSTYNKGKYSEMQAFFAKAGIETIGAFELNLPDVEETGSTYAENSLLKAKAGADATGYATLADDSGIEVPALDNFPGVITARFSKQYGGFDAAVSELQRRVGQLEFEACYVAVLSLAMPGGEVLTTQSTLEGTLVANKGLGTTGFGYDPWFKPKGYDTTVSELSLQEKEKISHRGKALHQMLALIQQQNVLRAVS